jgi:hypothetical protein
MLLLLPQRFRCAAACATAVICDVAPVGLVEYSAGVARCGTFSIYRSLGPELGPDMATTALASLAGGGEVPRRTLEPSLALVMRHQCTPKLGVTY